MKRLALLLLLSAVGCTQGSSAEDVNRPGTWHASFLRLVDLDGPPYVTTAPAPAYPDRTMTAPTVEPSGCSPGCDCQFVEATDDCSGDLAPDCKAWGGFVETCPQAHTILDCSNLAFDSDQHTTGVCVLEDSSQPDPEFGSYQQLGRYQVTLDRLSYD